MSPIDKDDATIEDATTSSVLDPDLKVEVVRSDGETESVSLSDAIGIYERRREAALEEVAHCEKRIDELQKKWRRAVKGRVLRSGTSADVPDDD